MTVVEMAPDERAVRTHFDGALFQAGVAAGRWRLLDISWPHVTIAITAAPRAGAPDEFAIRFELSGYPSTAPTGCIWDTAAGTPLTAALRPKGDAVAMIFRSDWNGGAAMYAPWDRVCLTGHAVDWARTYPRSVWHSRRTLTFILEQLSERLASDDYLGV